MNNVDNEEMIINTTTIPDDIFVNPELRKYTKTDEHNKIIEIWERDESPLDYNDTDENGKVRHNYYGEWRQVPQEKIDELNKALKEAHKIRQNVNYAPRTAREADLEAAMALLAKLKEERGD